MDKLQRLAELHARMEDSGLIDELLDTHGGGSKARSDGGHRNASAGNRNEGGH